MYKSRRHTYDVIDYDYYGFYYECNEWDEWDEWHEYDEFHECDDCGEDVCICFMERICSAGINWDYEWKLARELDSFFPVGKKRIVSIISGLVPRNSYLYSCCDDKDLLPLWKLTLKTRKLIKLHLELAVPNCVNKTDIIDINCAILGKQYTKCTWNYITEFDISPCTTRRKMNKLTFDFEFRFDDTCYYEHNQHAYGMEQTDDSKYNHNNQDNIKSDQIKFLVTFEFDILRFKCDLDDESYLYGNSYRDCNNNSLRWFDFHFGDFNKLLDEIDIDYINSKNKTMPFTISYCCKDVLTKNIQNTKCIVDILRKKYNYGPFANVFYDLLNQYLYSSSSKYRKRSRYDINNINNNNKNSRINKRNKKRLDKCIQYNFNNIGNALTNRECSQMINELYYFDVCCASFNNPNILHNTWKQNPNDEHLYLLFMGQYTKFDHQWFLNSQTLHNIICSKKIVYDKYRNTGALSEYAHGTPYNFNHDHCDDDAHYDDDNNSNNARACDQESRTGISDEIHCQHTGQHTHTGQDSPSDLYFVYQRHMDDYDDDHVTTKVEIKNYHKKRRYYRFRHVKTDCKQMRKKKKNKEKRQKGKKNKAQFELDKWMNGGF